MHAAYCIIHANTVLAYKWHEKLNSWYRHSHNRLKLQGRSVPKS